MLVPRTYQAVNALNPASRVPEGFAIYFSALLPRAILCAPDCLLMERVIVVDEVGNGIARDRNGFIAFCLCFP